MEGALAFWDFALPGVIIFLKFGLKMTTDQETNGADTLKAILVFPVDIAFLSLSYGSAVLYTAQDTGGSTAPVKAILTIAFMAIALLIPVIILAKKSERAFVLSKTKLAGWLSVFGYFLALAITTISISIGDVI